MPTNCWFAALGTTCDCWSSLTSNEPNRKELARWRTIFAALHQVLPRFGFLVHFGNPKDTFELGVPVLLRMSDSAPLHRVKLDTYYDVIP